MADSLANTDVSDLAFVNQFFKFLPGRVRVRSQRLIDHDLPLLLTEFLLERDWPAVVRLSYLRAVTNACTTYQWIR